MASASLEYFFVNAQGWLQKELNVIELTILMANKILDSEQSFRVNPVLDTQLPECVENRSINRKCGRLKF